MVSEGKSRPHVVVGVDGSAESVGALRWAACYAAATGATITTATGLGPAPVGVALNAISDEERAHIQDVVLDKALIEVFGTSTPDDVQTKIVYGHPAQALVKESEDADLLVVGHRGHGAFTGMLVGSVSLHCVSSAACPVVVVRGRS
ncbi:MAG TPA: universal stress protein [Streptosporangiaceae bacterium]|nr:universal stress protein [Streptosporangiaceae bacterium]